MAGSSLSGPHPTIANLNVILTDTDTNSSLILLGSITGTLDTTANVYQKGCILYATDQATGSSGTYINTGTSASPVWSRVQGIGLSGGTYYVEGNANGSANAESASLFSSGTTKVPVTTGMVVAVRLKKGLQAGANTLNLNGTTKSIYKSSNPGQNLQTPFAIGSVIELVYTPGVTASGCFQAIGW